MCSAPDGRRQGSNLLRSLDLESDALATEPSPSRLWLSVSVAIALFSLFRCQREHETSWFVVQLQGCCCRLGCGKLTGRDVYISSTLQCSTKLFCVCKYFFYKQKFASRHVSYVKYSISITVI